MNQEDTIMWTLLVWIIPGILYLIYYVVSEISKTLDGRGAN